MVWQVVFVGLLIAHLIGMQIASAGPLVCLFLEWRGRVLRLTGLEDTARRLAGACSLWLISSVAAGLLLAGLTVTCGPRDYTAVIRRFHSRIWWGGWELLFYLVIMLIYFTSWDPLRRRLSGRVAHRCLAIAASTNLLYHFPPLFTAMGEYLQALDPPTSTLTSGDYRDLITRSSVVAKSLHFGMAALAVTGAWVLLRGGTSSDVPEKSETPDVNPRVRYGAIVCLCATGLQLVTGMWLLVEIAPHEQAQVMGGDRLAAGLLVGSIVLSLVAMNQLASLVFGDRRSGRPAVAAWLVLVAVACMVTVSARLSGLAV